MNKQIEALKLALEGLEKWHFDKDPRGAADYITAIHKALAEQPAQQLYDTHAAPGQSFDTHGRTPPAQEQSLQDLWHKVWPDAGAFVRVSADDLTQFARAIEAAHGITGEQK